MLRRRADINAEMVARPRLSIRNTDRHQTVEIRARKPICRRTQPPWNTGKHADNGRGTAPKAAIKGNVTANGLVYHMP
jgi:hypothetical protein